MRLDSGRLDPAIVFGTRSECRPDCGHECCLLLLHFVISHGWAVLSKFAVVSATTHGFKVLFRIHLGSPSWGKHGHPQHSVANGSSVIFSSYSRKWCLQFQCAMAHSAMNLCKALKVIHPSHSNAQTTPLEHLHTSSGV